MTIETIRNRRIGLTAWVAAAFAVAAAGAVQAGDTEREVDVAVGVETRWFPEDPQYAGQLDGVQSSVFVEPELHLGSSNGRHQFSGIAFLRLDGRDDERTHFDLREAAYRYVGDDWELTAGVGKVFWGVTESRHLVDLVNQDDLVEDVDREDKLGQPMINAAWQRGWGRIDAYALLGFRQPTFPGSNGRLRVPLAVDTDAAVWESGAEDRRVDLALRYSHYVGDWDFGVYAFEGTGREPRLELDLAGGRTIPHYDVIRQFGGEVQVTRGAWLGKLETIVRSGHGDGFAAFVAGAEYTFFQAFGAADVGVLVEYLYDGRDDTAPFTAFDDDVFVGSRVAWNDTQDTALLVGAIVDTHDGSTAGRIELERRLGERFSLEVEGRWFSGIDSQNVLSVFEQDSFANVRLTAYF